MLKGFVLGWSSWQTSIVLNCYQSIIGYAMKTLNLKILILTSISIFTLSCKSGPFNLLKTGSPHQQYERKLVGSGLDQTSMGTLWLNRSITILEKALQIDLPYKETGYFAAEKVEAAAFRFNLLRGQKLQVKLTKNPENGFAVYADVWEVEDDGKFKLLAFADSIGNTLEAEAKRSGAFILRLQPELLGSGSYTVEVVAGASLAFPLKNAKRNQIQSLFGVGRDADTRKHEGVDIFAPFRTPVIAVAAGRVTAVNENNLGGKVVWFRPESKDYTLYYAHLDEQTVVPGQTVVYGDTLGRMGNTGNAKTTAPHLHFGVYTGNGAVDPLPFIDPTVQTVPKINTAISQLNTTMRSSKNTAIIQSIGGETVNEPIIKGTILRVAAATGNYYKVESPQGEFGYVNGKDLSPTLKPLSKYKISKSQSLYDQPDSLAAVKLSLKNGEVVDVLGSFKDYQLVVNEAKQTGWIKTNIN
jgi:murein DD-endopeptidase MepM/ murein hydrolase activator NlpD